MAPAELRAIRADLDPVDWVPVFALVRKRVGEVHAFKTQPERSDTVLVVPFKNRNEPTTLRRHTINGGRESPAVTPPGPPCQALSETCQNRE